MRQSKWRKKVHEPAPVKNVPIGQLRTGRPPSEFSVESVSAGLAVVLYDGIGRVSGVVHCMLPSSRVDPRAARETPETFVDTGILALIDRLEEMGAQRERLKAFVVGGATAPFAPPPFAVGTRNVAAAEAVLKRLSIPITASHTGGCDARRAHFVPRTRELLIGRAIAMVG